MGKKTKKWGPRKLNIQKLRATQGCLTDCVAYYFNIHPQNVPFFIYPRKNWMKRLRAFFARRGLSIFWTPYVEMKNKGALKLVVGNSKRYKQSSHCVVYKGNKKVYDPNPTGNAMKGKPTHQLIISKF